MELERCFRDLLPIDRQAQAQSGQAIKLFQAPREITVPSILDDVNLHSYPTTELNERM